MGWMAGAAGLAFGLALLLLATFFATRNERLDRLDRLAEWSFVAFALLAIPTILAVAGRLSDGGLAVRMVTIVGLVGVAVVGLGELGSSLGLIDFRRIAPPVSAGFLGYLVWIGLASVLAITGGGLPAGLGWLGVVTIALGIGIMGWVLREPGVMRGEREPGRSQMIAFFVPMTGIVAGMVWLGLLL